MDIFSPVSTEADKEIKIDIDTFCDVETKIILSPYPNGSRSDQFLGCHKLIELGNPQNDDSDFEKALKHPTSRIIAS